MPDPWREVDFGRETVLAVGLGGRATTGYSGDVVRLAAREDGAPALRRETRPGRDCVVGRLVTQPRVAVRVARVDGEVSFQGSAVEQPCGGEVRGPAR
jgi:hypothetical protein